MHAASALVKAASGDEAAQRACDEIQQQDSDPTWDLGFLFTCGEFNDQFESIASQIREQLKIGHLIGCTAEAVVGRGEEVEDVPAVSLLTLRTESRWIPLQLEFVRAPDGGSIVGWPDEWLEQWPDSPQILMLADPFTFPADLLLEQVNDEHPKATIFGGMASGAAQPGDNRLSHGANVLSSGAVGVAFLDAPWTSVVSQGCRPIGEPLVVTKVEGNVLYELGGLPAYDQLMTIYETLPNQEKLLAQKGLHVGRVVSEYQDEFSSGDFLIRNVLGASRDEKSVSIGDYLRVGQTIQFHLRDSESADLDLRQSLSRGLDEESCGPALLCTCNGRGTRLFPEPHHDATVVQDQLGDIPIAGFFAQGEIGPVSGKNFLHGFTASLVIGRAKRLL